MQCVAPVKNRERVPADSGQLLSQPIGFEPMSLEREPFYGVPALYVAPVKGTEDEEICSTS
jgi:hypothetical protein